ncbi:restriction endonuclease subunit S [Cyclobacterium xiamenense]|uniref:restriction endonuclease subunit S n=1 Tax=Cyclobacterium xiamenense TaxID=1297121 RepID=UPI0035CEC3C8
MILKLEDHCEFINGGSWTADEYSSSGYPVLKVSNFDKDSISFDDLSYLQKESYPKYQRNRLNLFDIVIATVGSHPSLVNSAAGRVITIPKSAEGLLLNQNAVCLRTKDQGVIDQRYLGYLCKSQVFQHFIQQRGKGAANQMRIPIGGIKSFEFDFPVVENQRKIAATLSAYDDLIENNLKRIKLLEEKAQLTYEEWFVRMKFPGHESTPINEETGLPEGWEKKKIGEITKTSSGGTPSRKKETEYYENGTIPWVRTGELKEFILTDAEYKITEIGLKNSSAKVFPKDTVLLAMYGNTIGETSFVTKEVSTNQACCAFLVGDKSYLSYFLHQYLLYNKNYILNYRMGAAQENISQTIIQNIKIILPSKDLLKLFAGECSKLYKSIETLIYQNQLLKEARDILLPRLMTGMIDPDKISGQVVDALDLSAFENGDADGMLMAAEPGRSYSSKNRTDEE